MKSGARIARRVLTAVGAAVALFLAYLAIVAVVPGMAVPPQPFGTDTAAVARGDSDAGLGRRRVAFEVNGTPVNGWLYLPDDLAAPVPAVVMANGAGGTVEMAVPEYAARFREAGYAALAFDYRCWGESGGAPRQLLWIPDQLVDLAAALEFARGRPEIDASRIALWGTSFGGGHVLVTAAEDPGVRAVIAQVPFLDGRAAMELEREDESIGLGLRAIAHAQRDLVRSWLGLPAHYVPFVGRPGTIAVLAGKEAWDFFSAHAPAGYENQVPARILIRADKYRPVSRAREVRAAVLLQMAERDRFAPASAIEAAARELGERATLKRYPIGHFEIYAGAAFEQSVADQLAFLDRELGRK
ncbi:MAG: acetylxylan esterase [Deltaproteobacteria bacterium]|nr:acetylxylan esterase [Deltaproteobacteria bacterium]